MPNTSILTQLTSTNSTNTVTIYQPQAEHSGYITTLKATINLKSIAVSNTVYIPDSTPPETVEQILAELGESMEYKEISLKLKKGSGPWIGKNKIRLFNKDPEYEIDLMSYLTDANTVDVADDLQIGLQMAEALGINDSIVVFGFVVEEKKTDDLEALAAKVEALELALYGRLTGLPLNSLLAGDANGFAVPLATPLSIALGGTGSNSKTWVGLTGNESIADNKEFTGAVKFLNATPATNTTTGTTFAGGVGVAGRGYFGIGVHAPNAWLLEPRSGSTVINANTLTFNQYAGTIWIDGSATNLNFPINSGMLMQFDSLFGTGAANLYKVQEFTDGNGNFWKRNQNNGAWGAWKKIAFV